eukprot:3319147-Prymnesium_polylepis.1
MEADVVGCPAATSVLVQNGAGGSGHSEASCLLAAAQSSSIRGGVDCIPMGTDCTGDLGELEADATHAGVASVVAVAEPAAALGQGEARLLKEPDSDMQGTAAVSGRAAVAFHALDQRMPPATIETSSTAEELNETKQMLKDAHRQIADLKAAIAQQREVASEQCVAAEQETAVVAEWREAADAPRAA